MSKNKRVCLPVSWACNSNCVFCMDDWSLSNFVEMDDIRSKLNSARKYWDEVTFSSLEPTLHPKLTDIVLIAKELWFKKIEIVTNWRKLKDFKYTKELIESWLNEFNFSIHSYNAEKHDSIVRSDGAFKEALEWLINIWKLKKEFWINLSVSVTVCKQNYLDIKRIVYFLEKFSLDNVILNILQPKNAAEENKDITYIEYSKMIKEFLKLREYQDKYNNIYINWLTPCLEEELHDIVGYFNGAQINRKDDDWNYIVDYDPFKKKREKCKNCKYYNTCEWVWISYIDKFWWEEFTPVIKD